MYLGPSPELGQTDLRAGRRLEHVGRWNPEARAVQPKNKRRTELQLHTERIVRHDTSPRRQDPGIPLPLPLGGASCKSCCVSETLATQLLYCMLLLSSCCCCSARFIPRQELSVSRLVRRRRRFVASLGIHDKGQTLIVRSHAVKRRV